MEKIDEHIFQMGWFNHQLPSLKLTAKAPENRPLEKEIPIGNHRKTIYCTKLLGCPAGSDRNERDRKLVEISPF